MKRVVAVIALVLCIVSLAACGEKDPLVDTWEVQGAVFGGEYVDSSDIYFEFNKDNTGETRMEGEVLTFTWEYSSSDEAQGLRIYHVLMEGGNQVSVGIGPKDDETYGIMMVYHSEDLVMIFKRAE